MWAVWNDPHLQFILNIGGMILLCICPSFVASVSNLHANFNNEEFLKHPFNNPISFASSSSLLLLLFACQVITKL